MRFTDKDRERVYRNSNVDKHGKLKEYYELPNMNEDAYRAFKIDLFHCRIPRLLAMTPLEQEVLGVAYDKTVDGEIDKLSPLKLQDVMIPLSAIAQHVSDGFLVELVDHSSLEKIYHNVTELLQTKVLYGRNQTGFIVTDDEAEQLETLAQTMFTENTGRIYHAFKEDLMTLSKTTTFDDDGLLVLKKEDESIPEGLKRTKIYTRKG